jgi:hypothetical protein
LGLPVSEGYDVDWNDTDPKVSKSTLKKYHAYLRDNLKFPFKAGVEGLKGEATIYSLFDLDECPELTFYGLFVSVVTMDVLSSCL